MKDAQKITQAELASGTSYGKANESLGVTSLVSLGPVGFQYPYLSATRASLRRQLRAAYLQPMVFYFHILTLNIRKLRRERILNVNALFIFLRMTLRLFTQQTFTACSVQALCWEPAPKDE